jgi:hypothetical protein
MRYKIWTYAGKLPFCSRGEIDSALADIDPREIKSLVVGPRVAALINCYCCGFPLDATVGGKPICEVK